MRNVISLFVGALVVGLAAVSPAGATFPGKNGLLVFSGVDTNSGSVQVFTLAGDGSGGPTRLTPVVGGVWNESPSWSADAKLIYFDVFDMNANTTRIYRMDANGGSRTLSDSTTPAAHLAPSVDQTGTRVAAVEFGASGSAAIIRQRPDGSNRVLVAAGSDTVSNFSPQYAPDGPRILFNQVTFASGGGIQSSDIVIANNGGHLKTITRRSDDQFSSPSWAPDAKTILAVRDLPQSDQIVRMTPGGTNIVVLLTLPAAEGFLALPTFSPDGKKIAFERCTPINPQAGGDCGDPANTSALGSIWVMNADGSNPTKILDQTTTGVQPDISTLSWGVGQ